MRAYYQLLVKEWTLNTGNLRAVGLPRSSWDKITDRLDITSLSTVPFNPYVRNGLSHPYHLDESIFIFRGIGNSFYIFISFSDEIHVRKQDSPSWDAALCGITSGAILFTYVL